MISPLPLFVWVTTQGIKTRTAAPITRYTWWHRAKTSAPQTCTSNIPMYIINSRGISLSLSVWLISSFTGCHLLSNAEWLAKKRICLGAFWEWTLVGGKKQYLLGRILKMVIWLSVCPSDVGHVCCDSVKLPSLQYPLCTRQWMLVGGKIPYEWSWSCVLWQCKVTQHTDYVQANECWLLARLEVNAIRPHSRYLIIC